LTKPETFVCNTTCPYCGVGCGVIAQMQNQRIGRIVPDKIHPANLGRLCSKGTALATTFDLSDRLLSPKIRENGKLRDCTFDEAFDKVATKFRQIIDEFGKDAVAFYVSGQLLTEDYYAVNKLAKGIIGTANIDTNSRLCMASAVVAHKKSFGADLVPAIFEDVEICDLLIFSGHNAAWTHPVLLRRAEQNKNQFRIVIDPRETETAKSSDLHLKIKPQSDVRLWNGLAAYLINNGFVDGDFINKHTSGIIDLKHALEKEDQSLKAIAQDCGISTTELEIFYDYFAKTPKTITLFSQGSNQSSQGVNKGLAVINAHLITGKIGKKGAAPFSITGQPNAMGGREVGGLANTLACHMDFDAKSVDLVSRFWQSENVPNATGLKAVDMFRAIEEGKIKAIWIMATNPMVSMPDTNQIARALTNCEMVVVSDVVKHNDTLDFAHVQLPAAAWGEKDGTVTNSDRIISRQRAFLKNENTRPDWWLIKEIGQRIYPEFAHALNWQSPAQVFDEYARMTAFENNGRFLNLSGLIGLSELEYDELMPIRWPVLQRNKGAGRLFENGKFQTNDGRAIINIVQPAPPAQIIDKEFPLALNSSRIRDQWHTMTRTATSYRLNQHIKEPLIDIHPIAAAKFGIKSGHLAIVKTRYGQAIAKANITTDVRENDIHLPMHFTKNFAPFGRSNQLINPFTDPISGQPEFKHTPANIAPYNEKWHGFILIKKDVEIWHDVAFWADDVIWRRTMLENADLYEIAGLHEFEALNNIFENGEIISLDDTKSQNLRRAKLIDNKLVAIAFICKMGRNLPAKDWLIECFGKDEINSLERAAILIGKMAGTKDLGPLICACNSVFENTIIEAVQNGQNTIDKIGECCGAGTSCGSCKSEIGRIIASNLKSEVYENAK
jgi:assimilatory nitrate reductase catalytic subunit